MATISLLLALLAPSARADTLLHHPHPDLDSLASPHLSGPIATAPDTLLVHRSIEPHDVARAPMALDTRQNSSFVMPRAFDANVGNNFTQQSCLTWFNSLLNDIYPCHPISLMLQTSVSFFDATKSLVTITRVLDASCSVDFQQCSSTLSDFASQILQPSVCQADYRLGNPIVTQAYAGLLAYQPIYGAMCLTNNNATGNYCYANSVTNSSTPTASYIYYLPLGFQLPGGTMPSCNKCVQKTMQGFATFASNASMAIAQTYPSAAAAINVFCGPTFVDQNVAVSGAMVDAVTNLMFVTVAAFVSGAWLLA